jgi:hypothetical protein
MHFEDGSSYCYLDASEADSGTVPAVNVGWLEKGHVYEKGPVPESFLESLFWYCTSPVNRTRGLHICQFCVPQAQHGGGVSVQRNGIVLTLGGAEIRVRSSDGTLFAAPDLIYHYVEMHRYLPPQSFVSAVMEGDRFSGGDSGMAKKSKQ